MVHDRAGQPAQPGDLVDVARLVTAYYSSARPTSETIARDLSLTPNALRQSLFRIRKVLLECVQRTLQADSR